MKKQLKKIIWGRILGFAGILLIFMIQACQNNPMTVSPPASSTSAITFTSTAIPPSPTATLIPTATPDPAVIASWNADTVKVISVFKLHADHVRRLVWSPDGSMLASAGNDRTVHVIDPTSGESLFVFKNHKGEVEGLDWSPDGKMLASASWDKTTRVWDPLTGEQFAVLQGHKKAHSGVAWSPDGTHLATISYDYSLIIWDTATWKPVFVIEKAHDGDIKSVAWSKDGTLLATGGKDGKVNIWDPNTGELFRALWGHVDYVLGVSWAPGENKLASGGFDQTVRIWNADSGEELFFFDKSKGLVNTTAWSPVGPMVASAGWDINIGLWDVEQGTLLEFLYAHRQAIWTIAWSPDGKKIASGDTEGKVFIWGIKEDVQGETPNTVSDCTQWAGTWEEYPCEICAEKTGYVLSFTVNDACEISGASMYGGFESQMEGNITESTLQFREFGDEQGCYFYGDLELKDKYFEGVYSTTCDTQLYGIFRKAE